MTTLTHDVLGALLGDLVDADTVVAKMSPDPSSVHTPGLVAVRRRRRPVGKRAPMTAEERKKRAELERKVAQVSNVVGLAAGTAGTVTAVQGLRRHKMGDTGPVTGAVARRLKVKPRTAARLGLLGAGSATALQGANVLGDVVTARVLGRKDDVGKALPLKDLVRARVASARQVFSQGRQTDQILAGGQRGAANRQRARVDPQVANTPRQKPAAYDRRPQGYAGPRAKGPMPTLSTFDPASAKPQRFGLLRRKAPAGTYTNANSRGLNPGERAGAITPGMKGPLTPAQQQSAESGFNARTSVENFLGTTGGKVAAGGAGLLALNHLMKKPQPSGDPYAYGKRAESVDVSIGGTFSKFDEDKRRAYGWASVVSMNGEPVIDRQGDYIGLDDIEEAAYAYVRKSRVAGDMHRRTTGPDGADAPHKAGELIESVVFTPEKCRAMGLPMACAGKWWMGVQVEDEDVWQEVKKGNRTGFSIHGKGIRKDVSLDEIRG